MNILDKAVLGAKWGLVVAGLLSLWVLVLAILAGSFSLTSRTGETFYIPSIIALYLVGGGTSGGILGALSGLMRWRIGALLIGMLAALPLAVAFLAMKGRLYSWGRVEAMFTIVFCTAFGGGGGLILREFVRGRLKSNEP